MRAALLLVALGLPAVALAGSPDLVAEGERWWTQSPDPANPVACATCHHDPAETRGWAPSFPKWKPQPPPHARVMTLLQASAEAVARHYRLADPLRAATAITAYLGAQGAGLPLSPGMSPGQPVFSGRMEALADSVRRGGRLFDVRCGRCHRPERVTPSWTAFPRVRDGHPEPLEVFLERHGSARESSGRPPGWDSPETADLLAYLVFRLTGRPAQVETLSPREGSR